jgi:hypothetical protein
VDRAVERSLFPFLRAQGYQVMYACKAAGAQDGVALCWRTDRLRRCGGARRVLFHPKKAHVALLQRLRWKAKARKARQAAGAGRGAGSGREVGRSFVAAVTHLKAGMTPEMEQVRLEQTKTLASAIDAFRQDSEPVIMAADLNAHPGVLPRGCARVKPLVVPFLERAGYRCSHREVPPSNPHPPSSSPGPASALRWGSGSARAVLGAQAATAASVPGEAGQGSRAAARVCARSEEEDSRVVVARPDEAGDQAGRSSPCAGPYFTMWCGRGDLEAKTIFDYVFVRGPSLTVLAALLAPAGEDISGDPCRLPNPRFPSDHIPVVVDIGFCYRALEA